MNNISDIQRCAVVLVGAYTRVKLKKALAHTKIGQTHYLIKNWSNYPRVNTVFRVDLELREKTNPGNFIRPADLFDLVRFAAGHPELILEHGPVEGFDFHLDAMGKELGVSLTIPFVRFSGGKIEVSLDHNNKKPDSLCQLVVTSQRRI